MPLRALVNGRELQVWNLTRAQWAALRQLGRNQASSVLMACCGRPGVAKTSRKGNPFFAHRTGSGSLPQTSCRWAGESTAHALCKLLAAAGARAAGWQVQTEATAPDGQWRADLLCSRGRARVALEVQLAPISLELMQNRQQRYRAAGVRGAWLVPAERCPAPSRPLPTFPLDAASATVGPGPGGSNQIAGFDGEMLPLDVFVRHLLQGRVRFQAQQVERPLPCPVLVTAPDACRRCGSSFLHVAGVTNLAAGALPRYRLPGEVAIIAVRDLWEEDRRQAWQVADGARRLRRAEPGLSPLAPRRCRATGASYLMALCPGCGQLQGDHAVDRLLTSPHPQVPVRVPVPPAPLTYHPLDGRAARAALGNWRERILPARWYLALHGPGREACRDRTRIVAQPTSSQLQAHG
jgi:competence protein CoiA